MARAAAFVLSMPTFARALGVAACFALSGCIGESAFDEINATQPVGSAFSAALFKNYSYLAKSFGTQSSPAGQAFDAEGAISLTGADNTISGLANAYAEKALAAGRGDEVLPEPAPDGDADAENVRLELLRDLDDGRDKTPDQAARAQADYDCWLLNRRVPSLVSASRSCRRSVTASLTKLEHELNPSGASQNTVSTAPIAAPNAPPPIAQPAQFTVLFGLQSASLSADAMTTISQVIAAARSGRQSHITVVGHTDTDEDSERLSVRRANAVEAALVEQGARSSAISTSGVGKDDPAVQTGDHVKEPKNRRVVISLVP
jgi:outer membrane protein OmpA-like peptidoglycan-associated protein